MLLTFLYSQIIIILWSIFDILPYWGLIQKSASRYLLCFRACITLLEIEINNPSVKTASANKSWSCLFIFLKFVIIHRQHPTHPIPLIWYFSYIRFPLLYLTNCFTSDAIFIINSILVFRLIQTRMELFYYFFKQPDYLAGKAIYQL